MGSEEVLGSSAVIMDPTISPCNGSMVQLMDDGEENENLGVDLLNDLDLYLEDIKDRLTISRLVSDSVIKGIVSAVEQEAALKIAEKELELTRLKKGLHLYIVGSDDGSVCSGMCQEQKNGKNELYSDTFVEHDRLQESLRNLNIDVKGQLTNLKKEIHKVKGSYSMRRRNSSSEIVGLGGILLEKMPDEWSDVDKMFDGLGTTLDSFCKHAEDMVHFPKSLFYEWQQEGEFQAEIEGLVIKNSIRGLQEELDQQRFCDQNTQFYSNGNAIWLEKVKELSSLRQELDAIAKSLSVPESGHLISHGSLEHWKSSGHHFSNGNHDESIITMPENLEAVELIKDMSKEELFHYLKTEMIKMKRDHESKVQNITEEIFALKGAYLKGRGSTLPGRKDKDFDTLRKKILEVILKLDNILIENEKVPAMSDSAESLDTMKDGLESLRIENHKLQDLLAQKQKEIKLLSSQVSHAAEKTLQHSRTEVNLFRMITNLKSSIEDAHVEATISEHLYKLLLKEFMGQIKCFSKESDLEYNIMEGSSEIIFREAAQNVKPASKLDIEDSDMESIIMQGVLEIGLQEAFKEAEVQLSSFNLKYIDENEAQLSLEREAMEKLEQEIHLLKATIKEKDKLVRESVDELEKEKENFELVSQELHCLKVQTYQQGLLTENLRETAEERSRLLAASQEKLSLVEARERNHREKLASTIFLVSGLTRAVTDFESRSTKEIERKSLRLENLNSQFGSLIQKVSILKRRGFLYKKNLESRCSDLRKAEAEVCP
ncbi:PREDICTED: WPP domain-associated protein-like isoform X2 [Populus euphratica]|uniref:WPP domain-associated protein-like isoform X2 n=1 Tax=Populus euphratica TaxID=75702 RepID=A0AAJ6V237_POPEU|nr:PREDICTED: WPP domain-associated protein-like isoform X2 [Populus euphratica]